MTNDSTPQSLEPSILIGAYIRCDKRDCSNHDLIEDFPNDAAQLFFEKGWRKKGNETLCPDHSGA